MNDCVIASLNNRICRFDSRIPNRSGDKGQKRLVLRVSKERISFEMHFN